MGENIEMKEFQDFVVNKFDELKELFLKKNQQYGDIDPLGNFKLGAALNFGITDTACMYETLKGYMNKHVVHVYGHGITGAKADESWGDIAVYSIIAMYMRERYYAEHMKDIEDDTNEKA